MSATGRLPRIDEIPIFTTAQELRSTTIAPRIVQPGQQTHVSWWIENTGDVPILLTGVVARFLADTRPPEEPDDPA
jgi:hypothetical protein